MVIVVFGPQAIVTPPSAIPIVTQPSLPPKYALAQLLAVVAINAVFFALCPAPEAFLFAIASACILVVYRTSLPRNAPERSIGCIFALLGFCGGGALGVYRSSPQECGLAAAVMPVGGSVCGTIVGGILGRFIALALYRRRLRSVDRDQFGDPDQHDLRRQNDLAEYEQVGQLMAQAENDGDNEVFMKLAAYRAKLEHDLGL
jgi:hypothetical protein